MNISQEVIKRISPYMKSRGFIVSGRNFHYIANDIAYCVALDSPGGLLYATAYVIPLYIPCENRYYTYGNRLNTLRKANLPPLRKGAGLNELDEWCESLCSCIEKIIIPFYKEIGTPAMLVAYVERKNYLSSTTFSCPEVFIERLKMYTYLYLQDLPKTNVAMKTYRTLLTNCAFLTKLACQKYLDEINIVQSLLQGNEQEISNYKSKVMDITKTVLL